MHPNAQLLQTFYSAFQRRDAEAMAACYHPDAEFSDSVFRGLNHAQVTDMWRMLCAAGKDLQIEFRDVQADDASGRAHWDARYTFSKTGRKVLNRIDATFTFRDGKILRHQDAFGLWQWTRQALGPVGLALGWSPLVQNKVRSQAMKSLDAFMRERGAKSP
ncbi:nuclear transport factor 2 family protein [Myxococcaceae bacterium GXIMD 01537]